MSPASLLIFVHRQRVWTGWAYLVCFCLLQEYLGDFWCCLPSNSIPGSLLYVAGIFNWFTVSKGTREWQSLNPKPTLRENEHFPLSQAGTAPPAGTAGATMTPTGVAVSSFPLSTLRNFVVRLTQETHHCFWRLHWQPHTGIYTLPLAGIWLVTYMLLMDVRSHWAKWDLEETCHGPVLAGDSTWRVSPGNTHPWRSPSQWPWRSYLCFWKSPSASSHHSASLDTPRGSALATESTWRVLWWPGEIESPDLAHESPGCAVKLEFQIRNTGSMYFLF